MIKSLLHILLGVLLLISSQQNLFASHGAGLDISYECVYQGINSNNYKITVKFYRDCGPSSSSAQPTFVLDYTSISCGNNSSSTMNQVSSQNITPTCIAISDPCNTAGVVGIEEYVYQTIIILPNNCPDWVLTVCATGNRNGAITTIVSPLLQELCVEAEIINTSICNTSPSFTEFPAPYICAGQTYCYNNGAIDPDGDSLVYSLVTPMTANGGTVNYNGVYTASNPVTGTTTFDPATGDLCILATAIDVTILAMKVSEYRNGVKIGSVLRDIQIIVLNCPISPPVLSGFNGTPQNVTNAIGIQDSLSFCANNLNNINFSINSNLGISNNQIMSWSGINGIPSASFVIANNNSNTPTGTFNWIPQLSDVINSPFTFTVNIEDDACPINNQFSYTYTITLSSNASFNILYDQINNPSCIGYNDANINLTVTGTNGLTTYDWTGPNSFNSTNEDINNLFSGTYTISITDAAGCVLIDNINIIDPADLNISSILDSVSCVGANNGGIDITVTPNSGSLIYSWIGPNNFSSTNEDITFLAQGIYELVITDAAGCLFNEVILLPTSNPFNASTIVDSISCIGYSDGAINLTVSATNNSLLTFSWTGPNGFTSTNEDINYLFPGTYNITITDPAGCIFDASIILYEPSNITSLTTTQACDSYSWNNAVYSTSGLYTYNTPAVNGCDSTAILNLLINNSSSSTAYVQSCNEYTWNGLIYTVSGTYTFNTLNNSGCDSIASLVLTISNFSTSTALVKDCNPYLWNGVIYEYSGVYTYTSTNIFGCDSIATLDLTITSYSINSVSPICINDSSIISIGITDPTNNNYKITINDFITSSIYIIDSLGNLFPQGIPINVSPETTTQLVLTSVIDENNCQTYTNDTVIIRVNPLPIIDVFLDDICINEPPFLLNKATPPGGIYLVDNIPTNLFNASIIGEGEHILSYHYRDSITNCIAKENDVLRVIPKPNAEFYCDYYITKQDTPITFFNTSSDYINLYWNLDNGSFFQDSISFLYSYEDIGIYNVQLIAVNEYNCSDSVINDISVISSYTINIPSAFTPNGDDHNEKFHPVGEGIINYHITIYNRWGERIFDGANNTPWLGEKCSNGAYTYVIDIINLKDKYFQYIGDIFLIK